MAIGLLKIILQQLGNLRCPKTSGGWPCRPCISGVKILIPSTWKAVGDLKV